MKAIIEISEQMEIDHALCGEDSDCDGCACCIGDGDCIYNYMPESEETKNESKSTMKASDFALIVTEMIRAEKDEFMSFIENEDWDGLHDEILEYAGSCD